MINKIKQALATTKLLKPLLWFKYTHGIGLSEKFSNPSSNKTKQQFIKKVAIDNNVECFVETGTYLGDMVFANIDTFAKIYSIELDGKLYQRAKKRFENYEHVTVIQGDSAKVLKKIINKLQDRTLFWLDAHYSGGITAIGEQNTPIEIELKMIINKWHKGSIIIIDDARLFTGEGGYPTIKSINKIVTQKNLSTKIIKDMILIKQ